jgi:hypothetical protein
MRHYPQTNRIKCGGMGIRKSILPEQSRQEEGNLIGGE